VGQSLQQLEASFEASSAYETAGGESGAGAKTTGNGREPGGAIHFVPWRGDFTRGIFVSSQLRTNASLAGLEAIYKEYYESHPFTLVSPTAISLKQVVNTNKCLIQLEKQGEQLGRAFGHRQPGERRLRPAVQNMNLLFGLEETTGLHLKANAFKYRTGRDLFQNLSNMKLFDVYPVNDITIVKARGSYVWDHEGQQYLDLYGGHAVISIGHTHPHYVQRITTSSIKWLFIPTPFISRCSRSWPVSWERYRAGRTTSSSFVTRGRGQ